MCERNQELKARYRSPSFSGGTNNMKITYQIKKKYAAAREYEACILIP